MHFFVEMITAFSVALLMGNVVTAAPAHNGTHALEKRHGWHDCIKHDGTKIPDMLPDHLQREIRCNAAPTGKYGDSHCSNVFQVAREFCREHAVQDPIKLGNKTYLHEEYLRGWEHGLHLAYIMKQNIDDYHISVQRKRHCHEDIGGEYAQWKERTPVYDQCMGLLWASWSQCSDNKGRGGWVNAGCYRYSLKTID